ncbi:hypothetical protein ZIOFF_060073 [Zingiber officinale]|uniref:Methyltransferase type 11 domain-containing protein n=1 Tax=Zingiber officinale TaxID=94328 RepID=A0A8J5FE47_ZINOF|nr:hypothetical protein ZIOFF_060073 [Zingiber officinale]
MGSVEETKKRLSVNLPFKLKILLLVASTNLVTVYLCSGGGAASPLDGDSGGALFLEHNATQRKLADSQVELVQLQNRLATASGLLENLLGAQRHGDRGREEEEDWPEELKLAVGPHKLPLGRSGNLGTDGLFPAMGSACRRFREELTRYMTYEVGKECPSDAAFAQRLMLKGCEPLPRRRCHPPSPNGYVEPAALPESLWTTPADTSVVWDAYTCKNYSCLVQRGRTKGSNADCNDCFDLEGREKSRWLADGEGLDFGMDAVLAARPEGTVRLGLDIGGGSGTFAARMRERGVTVVSTTMDFDGPFNSFIAARGLVALHLTVAHRLPFYDRTLDIVHSMHVLSNWIPDAVLEFALFDIYRVLRPGGLFWLDHFFCSGDQLDATYGPMIGRIGFSKLRWVTGRKLDRGVEKNEWYLSALLEKPLTFSI